MLAALFERRGHDDERGVVPAARGVIAAPHGEVPERAVRRGVEVRPCVRVRIAGFQIRQPEHGLRVVHELAQEQVPELVGAVRVQFLKNLHGLRGQWHNVHLLHLGAGCGNAPLTLLKVELALDGGAEFGRAHEDQRGQP